MREVALVGNGPLGSSGAAEIDAASRVVRFNVARGFGAEAGSRLDDLFLVNCGGQMHEWLLDPAFWTSPPLLAARRVTLPIAADRPEWGLWRWPRVAPHVRDGVNFERDVRRRLDGRRVRTVPDRLRRGAIRALRRTGPPPEGPVWPSTGFLALFLYDAMLPPETRITLHGFGFEGAACHPWARERAWVERRAATGRVRLAGDHSAATASAAMPNRAATSGA
ncbi:hypothetical protein JQC91_03945 [Jannaschia sp. Os4]|uniref:hypothetical protein n=1 Tax=Jannaschia sp. Os4 TaxID=2807617 RepID=UPI00193977EE|nr:hypothetical protein [Jannaschia sp. Os4]MBM2575447.1 hypothetical protein [Jannaschia sp. Os4]